MADLSFKRFSVSGIVKCLKTASKSSPLFLLHCFGQNATNLTLLSEFSYGQLKLKFFLSIATKILSENCGTQTTKPNFARHKKICYVGTFFSTGSPFSAQGPELI